MLCTKLTQLILASAFFSAAANASLVFNFDANSPGTATGFTDTMGGLSATFSSPADPGGFVIYPSFFQTLTGNVLGDPGPAGLDNLALTVAFSQNLSAITLSFATFDFASPSPLSLTAYQNSNPVGFISQSGMFLSGFSFPEGQITFSGNAFNKVVISSTAQDFAVDNINLSPAAATPEPSALMLSATGLLALIISCALQFVRRRLPVS